MTIFGIEDVSVTGIVSEAYDKFVTIKNDELHKVDLIYGSAMPLENMEFQTMRKLTFLANQVLLGQYTCAMKWLQKRKLRIVPYATRRGCIWE